MFQKIKRVYSRGDLNYLPKFRENFPELNMVDREDLAERFMDMGVDFYTEEETKVPFIVRLTMPFAFLTMLLMFIFIPINYLIKGRWGYSLGKTNKLYNWFKSVKLQ